MSCSLILGHWDQPGSFGPARPRPTHAKHVIIRNFISPPRDMQLQISNDLHVLCVIGLPSAGRPVTWRTCRSLWLAIEMSTWFEKIEPARPSPKKNPQTTPVDCCFILFFKRPPVDPYHGSTGGRKHCFPPLFVQQVRPCAGGKFFFGADLCVSGSISWSDFAVIA